MIKIKVEEEHSQFYKVKAQRLRLHFIVYTIQKIKDGDV
jgi:hypothetical protein